jgi:hypothetical protein
LIARERNATMPESSVTVISLQAEVVPLCFKDIQNNTKWLV